MNDLNSIILYLNNKNITVIPSEIQYLTNLQELNLSNNKITVISREIQFLTNLQRLDLTFNKI